MNECIKGIEKVVKYIHENPLKNLSVQELANIAGFSPFYFHRIFSAYIGESVNVFVKRVRLEKAASKLIHTKYSITEIAQESGYETSASFTKAFKKVFGVAPSSYKIENYVARQNKLSLLRKKEMEKIIMEANVEIREVPEEKVYYVRKIGYYKEIGCKAFEELGKFIFSNKLECPNGQNGIKIMGVCFDDPEVTDIDKCRYDACITFSKEVPLSGNVQIETVFGGKYAVFLHKGPYEKLEETYRAICGEWVPSHNYRPRMMPMLEVYLNDPQKTAPQDLLTEVYLPIE